MLKFYMIKWNEGLNLGVKVLDDDHKKLLEIINELLDAISDDKAQDIIRSIFTDLEEYSIEHCKREEVLLKKCNYTQFNEQTRHNKEFSDKIVKLKTKYLLSKEYRTPQKVSIFLTDWLFNHIIEENIPVISLFEKCGLSEENSSNDSLFSKLIKKTTNTFTFTKRIFLSAMIPLIGMLILIFIILWSNYYKHEEMKKTSSVTHILPNINELAHAIQIERGLSCGYISSSQNKFRVNLQKQRKIVDNTIESFTNKLETIHSDKLLDIKQYIDIFKRDINTFDHFRQRVDKKELSQNATINFYTNIIKNILGITSKTALLNLNKKVSSSILTLSSLLYYKETLGIKRATGTAIIEKVSATTDEYIKFIQLLGTQETFLNSFNQTASKTQKKSLNSIINSTLAKKINLHEENIKNHHFKDIDSVVWFNNMTELINHIKLFEDKLLSEITMQIENNMQNAVKNLFLWLIYTTFIFMVTFIIIYLFEYSSKQEISKFTDAMKHLAEGGRSLRLRANTTKGEMAQMYDAYEITRQKLLKGDIHTQLYLSQKELEIKEKEKENIELEEMASIDPLTNCVNRRKFEELSSLELQRAIRYKSDLSFIMLDIDHFKAVNDTYGHAIGDEVLKHFSSVCLEMARALDVVARIGGEEFVVMLPETNSKGAYIFAERFREKIFNSSITVENHTIKYSVSIGISVLDDINDKDVKVILERADKALYRAKESGRNTSVIYKA